MTKRQPIRPATLLANEIWSRLPAGWTVHVDPELGDLKHDIHTLVIRKGKFRLTRCFSGQSLLTWRDMKLTIEDVAKIEAERAIYEEQNR